VGGGFDPKSQPNFSRYQYHADESGAITIKGLDHSKRVYDLTDGLIRRGYSDTDIRSILGGNAMRVLGQIWSKE
jgi:membrane dipeptidase